ncbi:MAG: hypothetical protein AB7V40_00125 [Methyloceanibacter sp.]
MRKVFVALLLAGACAFNPLSVRAETGLDDCHIVRGTADARNRALSVERAERRLHHHIAHEMRSQGGKSIGPTHTHCIRNACEATAIVCRH